MGYGVVSLDINRNNHPDICENILEWDFKNAFPKKYFQVIAAGPPCEEYSVAKTVQARDFEKADKIIEKNVGNN